MKPAHPVTRYRLMLVTKLESEVVGTQDRKRA
jgi:hypothetical protein